jgi:hypothetical protein
MHHISKDRRSAESADLIYRGLLECMEEKPFDEITISDLQRASTVARTTFYRSFDCISDVLYWKCDACFQEVMSGFAPAKFPGEYELARYYFRYWASRSDILELLIKINRQDIIYACHLKHAELLHERYGDVPGLSQASAKYFMAIRTGFMISILTVWIREGKKESPGKLTKIIHEQLSILARAAAG